MPFAKPGSVIRDGTWKYIHFHNGLRELYNLKDDIGETKNLVPSMPEKAAEMDARLEAMLKAHGTEIPASAPAKAHVPARKKRAKKSTGNSGK
jgi:arylsulfatase A-like enzyme